MVQTAAQPIFGSETQTSRFPRPYCIPTLKNNPPKRRRDTAATPLATAGQIFRFLLTPEDTAACQAKRAGICPMETRQSWLGSLKTLFWIAAAIGLSLGISFL